MTDIDIPADLHALITQAGDSLKMSESELEAGLASLHSLIRTASLIRVRQLRGEPINKTDFHPDIETATALTLAGQQTPEVRRDLITVISVTPGNSALNAALMLSGLPPEWNDAPPAPHWPAREWSRDSCDMTSLELTAVAWARLHLAGLTGAFPEDVRNLFRNRCSALGVGGENPWKLSLRTVPVSAAGAVADLWSEQKFIKGVADMRVRVDGQADPLPPRLRGLEFSQLPKWAQLELERIGHPSVPVRTAVLAGLGPTPAPDMDPCWSLTQPDAPDDIVNEAEQTFTLAATLLAQAWSAPPDQLKNDVKRASRGQSHPALLAALHAPLVITDTAINVRDTPGFDQSAQSELTRLAWGGWTWLRRTLTTTRPQEEWLMMPPTLKPGKPSPAELRTRLRSCGAPDAPGLACAFLSAVSGDYLVGLWETQNALAINALASQACQWMNSGRIQELNLTPGSSAHLPWQLLNYGSEARFSREQTVKLLRLAQAQKERA